MFDKDEIQQAIWEVKTLRAEQHPGPGWEPLNSVWLNYSTSSGALAITWRKRVP